MKSYKMQQLFKKIYLVTFMFLLLLILFTSCSKVKSCDELRSPCFNTSQYSQNNNCSIEKCLMLNSGGCSVEVVSKSEKDYYTCALMECNKK